MIKCPTCDEFSNSEVYEHYHTLVDSDGNHTRHYFCENAHFFQYKTDSLGNIIEVSFDKPIPVTDYGN